MGEYDAAVPATEALDTGKEPEALDTRKEPEALGTGKEPEALGTGKEPEAVGKGLVMNPVEAHLDFDFLLDGIG